MSWLEKIEELTIDQLKKKDEIYKKWVIASILILSLCFIGLIIIKWELMGITIPLFVIPVNSVRVRKKIRAELKKRESKV
jgi:hypothetical protein